MFAGGGSEGYFMDDDEWRAVVALLAEECKGRVTSLAGVFELSAKKAAKKAAYCADLGIDFVQIQPPHYMVPVEDEVFYHFKEINDSADIGSCSTTRPGPCRGRVMSSPRRFWRG